MGIVPFSVSEVSAGDSMLFHGDSGYILPGLWRNQGFSGTGSGEVSSGAVVSSPCALYGADGRRIYDNTGAEPDGHQENQGMAVSFMVSVWSGCADCLQFPSEECAAADMGNYHVTEQSLNFMHETRRV